MNIFQFHEKLDNCIIDAKNVYIFNIQLRLILPSEPSRFVVVYKTDAINILFKRVAELLNTSTSSFRLFVQTSAHSNVEISYSDTQTIDGYFLPLIQNTKSPIQSICNPTVPCVYQIIVQTNKYKPEQTLNDNIEYFHDSIEFC